MDAEHESLRKIAVKWLTNSGHTVVLSELVSSAFETPDAIGWKYGNSTLVECKVSRSDLKANATKPSVIGDRCVGRKRYFMVPDGLIDASDPLMTGTFPLWGML